MKISKEVSRINEYFRTNVSRGLAKGTDSIDHEKKVIYGFAVMSKGFVKDSRGWEIDDLTLEQVVEAGSSLRNGVKARFGHPNMSETAFGKYLGRVVNFRKEANVVRADLHFADLAFNAPAGNLAGYVMEIAESDPDMFGASVVLSEASLEKRTNEDGTIKKNEQGDELPPVLRVKKISGTDVVDEPAANDGFFAKQFFSDSTILSAEMTEFLNKFLSNPDAVESTIAFLNRYQRNREESEKQIKQEVKMGIDIKELTVDQLKEQRPEMLESVKKESNEAGVKQERERTVSILKFSKLPDFKEYGDMAFECVEKGESFAEAEKKMMNRRLKDLQEGAPKSPGPNAETETPKLTHLERAKQYKAEHNCSMTVALKATAEKTGGSK